MGVLHGESGPGPMQNRGKFMTQRGSFLNLMNASAAVKLSEEFIKMQQATHAFLWKYYWHVYKSQFLLFTERCM